MFRYLLPLLVLPTLAVAAPGHKGAELPPVFQSLGGLPGDLDTSFNTSGRVTIAVDPTPTLEDHGIIVAPRVSGGYLVYGFLPPTGDLAVTALNDGGSVDTSFGINGRIIYDRQFLTVEAATIDNNGRVIIVGNSREPGSPSSDFDPYVCRFTTGGQPDSAFGGTSGCVLYPIDIVANGADYATAVTTDAGSIYVAGQVQLDTSDDFDLLALRMRSTDGTLITAFSGDGIATIPFDVNSLEAGGDTDGALAIARDSGTGLYIAGYADNDGDFDNDWVIAKIDVFSGSYVTSFCTNTTDCPGSERLNGRRHLPIITTFGQNSEQIQGMTFGADGNLVVAIQKHLPFNGDWSQVIETIKLNPTTGATIAGQSDVRFLQRYVRLEDIALDAAGNVLLSGVTSQNLGLFGADPQRVMFVSRLTPTLAADTSFTNFLGSPSASTLIDFPRNPNASVVDHRSEEMLIDVNQRILVAGSRLWRRDVPTNVFDYDHAVFRLNGGSAAPAGPNIFANGFE